ncbi:MAG: D-alanyl-D-alanine carboxypeptidase family protein [Christensenellales bacterium]
MPQRLFALLLCAALLISAVPPALAEDQPIEAERFVAPTLPPDAIAWDKNHPDILDEDMLYAHSAILIEADTGEVLFEKNADEIMFPASTTKIMTAYIALQMSDLENDVVTVSQNAIDLVPPTYQTIPLIAGEQVPMLDLISVMLIRSGNEAANAVAEYLAGSVESFADLMNQTAQMLGCSPNTHFANPSGVHDENHYTTARDLAVIAQACMKDERFASIVSPDLLRHASRHADGERRGGSPRRTIVGSTAILNPGKRKPPIIAYATGVKTGYTLAAGYCFVGSATKGGIDLISVVALRRRYPPLRGHQAPV